MKILEKNKLVSSGFMRVAQSSDYAYADWVMLVSSDFYLVAYEDGSLQLISVNYGGYGSSLMDLGDLMKILNRLESEGVINV